ncbi:hypothetical protein C8J57DRAFT_1633650 [Mycena rebaudengoi]|nr:hypothetical protein C8J57DRAFT_1633650 [Mycena rebaudengoi]
MSELEAFNASVHCRRVEIVREHGEMDYRLDCRFGRTTGRVPAVYGRSHTGLYGTPAVTTRTPVFYGYGGDPYQALRSCALTARSFVLSSQRRLFQSITLVDSLPPYERLALVLTSSPHLGAYVRDLTIKIAQIPDHYAPLKLILARLGELERLCIEGERDPYLYHSQRNNLLTNNPCLVDVLSTPSLECVAFDHLKGVPSSLISRALSSIPEVSLSFLTIKDEGEVRFSSQSHLEHLDVFMDAFEHIVPWVLDDKRLPYFQKLYRLALVFSPTFETDELHPKFIELLILCSSTIEHLELELNAPLLAAPTLPALWRLELRITIALVQRPEMLHSIISTAIASTPALEILVISVSERPMGHHQLTWASNDTPWSALDAALMNLRCLNEVHFSLRSFQFEAERYAAFVPYISAKLPRLQDAGTLFFEPYAAMTTAFQRFANEL